MRPIVEIKGLCYRTGEGVVLFEDVDLLLCEGEKVAIIGPHGSGKSTMLRIITGAERPERGDVELFDEEVALLNRREIYKLRRRIGVVFMDAALISNLKVIENVALPILYHTGLPRDRAMKRALSLLGDVGYADDVWLRPGVLPYHTKRMVALARALALDPDMLIFDRFLVGLDASQRVEMAALLDTAHYGKQGRLTIVTTNYEENIRDLSLDKVFKIEGRRLVGYRLS